MKYPDFFEKVKKIRLKDELSDFLGVFENGIVEFSYLDIVKAAGHSCATVAGAYISCAKALEKLFPDSLPVRGQIKVEFKNPVDEGVTGVIANVISNITGATEKTGFKGIAGNFARHSLMSFEADINGEIRFTDIKTGKFVDTVYNPPVPPEPEMKELMQKCIFGTASEDEKNKFKKMWQGRVEKIIIDNFDNPDTVIFI